MTPAQHFIKRKWTEAIGGIRATRSLHDNLIIQKERFRSLLHKLNSSAAAAPLSPRGLPQIHHAFRVCPCIKASGLAFLVQQQRSLPIPASEDRCLTVSSIFSSISCNLQFFSLHSYAFSFHYCLVEMISKSFIALLILTLTSSVNAAAIGPRQAVGGDGVSARDRNNPAGESVPLRPRCTRKTLLTSDLGLARDGMPPILERAAAPIPVVAFHKKRKFLFLSLSLPRCRLC